MDFKVTVKEVLGPSSTSGGSGKLRCRSARGLAMPWPWTIGPEDYGQERLMNKRMT